MGKKSGSSSSWLTAVKRAFRSPTKKEHNNNAHGNEVDEDEDKVRILSLVSRSCFLILVFLFTCSVSCFSVLYITIIHMLCFCRRKRRDVGYLENLRIMTLRWRPPASEKTLRRRNPQKQRRSSTQPFYPLLQNRGTTHLHRRPPSPPHRKLILLRQRRSYQILQDVLIPQEKITQLL